VHRDRSTALAINLSCASESFASATTADNEVGMMRTVLAAKTPSLLTLSCACVRSPLLGVRCW
jgi:hypothetical protein